MTACIFGTTALNRYLFYKLTATYVLNFAFKPRSYLPKYEIEAIVRTFFPAVAAFFETEEGNREFEEWKAKKEAEKNAKEKSA